MRHFVHNVTKKAIRYYVFFDWHFGSWQRFGDDPITTFKPMAQELK